MLLKRICCTVPKPKQKAFSVAQQDWKGLQDVPGFILQAGGWNMRNAQEAVIFSVWRSRKEYERFMETYHDPIFERSKQETTYSDIRIALFQIKNTIDRIKKLHSQPVLYTCEGKMETLNQATQVPVDQPGVLLAQSMRKPVNFCIIYPATPQLSNPQTQTYSFLQNVVESAPTKLIRTDPEWQVVASLSNPKI